VLVTRQLAERRHTSDPESFPWHRVRTGQVSALRADCADRLAPNTANKIMAAVKGG
jgi:hypothetical protein